CSSPRSGSFDVRGPWSVVSCRNERPPPRTTDHGPLTPAMDLTLNWYLSLSAVLFTIGVLGVLLRRNAIVIFLSIELMLNAVNLTLVAFSQAFGDVTGQILVFFVMSVAAAEAAVGLAIIIAIFRNKVTVNVDEINLFRG